MSTDHKLMAKRLRASLADRGVEVTHSEALEIVAHEHGARDWNTLAARPDAGASFGPVIPVLRIFDVAKAREFYGEYLGFAIDWEHTFEDHAPVYFQASREGVLLHLSEHHGDASPAATVRILVPDVMALHRELQEREYRLRPPRCRDAAVGAGGHGARPVRQPDRVPPAGRGGAHRGRRHGRRADRARVRRGVLARSTRSTCSPGEIDEWWHPAYAPPGLTDVSSGHRAGQGCYMRIADGSAYQWGTTTAWETPPLRDGLHAGPGPRPPEPDRRAVRGAAVR